MDIRIDSSEIRRQTIVKMVSNGGFQGRTPFYAVSVNGLHRDRVGLGLGLGIGLGLGRVVPIRQAIY